jgi:acyl-CoA reductase-like NAD-dependent aldehyde dehydrogenase
MQPLAAVSRSRSTDIAAALDGARRAQPAWAGASVARRLEVVSRLRSHLAERAESIAEAVQLPFRTSDAETLSAEVLPLADACRFLTQEAALVLAKRRLGRRRRPVWLGGSSVEVARVPWGVVAVIAPANYPLFIPGVQTLQALVAGNAVVLKPGHGGHAAAALLAALLDSRTPVAAIYCVPTWTRWC